ncbi:hypothetical protein GCM10019059_42910 [Camelimonas fluminis]|nr:hypothetical protein GCM10019059_42910 [Camelimonas fluminis]
MIAIGKKADRFDVIADFKKAQWATGTLHDLKNAKGKAQQTKSCQPSGEADTFIEVKLPRKQKYGQSWQRSGDGRAARGRVK